MDNAVKRRHPKGLPYLFLTEMWERFGFYVVQGMLVLYMTHYFGLSDDKSYTISGMFISLAYISPIVGGFIADRLLGFKGAIGWGGVFLTLGYAMLALSYTANTFYLSLATIIIGNGLFKPNISSLLGTLYSPTDPGRDSGFTIFYIGINFGILLAGIGSGILRAYFGWHLTFASASLGFIISLLTFVAGLKWGDMKYQSHVTHKKSFWLSKPTLVIYCLIAIGIVSLVIQSSFLSKWLLPVVGIFLLFFLAILTFKQERIYRDRLIMLNVLMLSSIVFWTIYWQMFLSANLFIDRLIDKHILGFDIPTTAFYTLESSFIILFGPILAWLWQFLNEHDKNPSPLIKFILGTLFVGLGFLVLSCSTFFSDANNLINPSWIILAYFMVTMGEILLSPIGLSAVALLSPPHLTGLMMGVSFVGLGFGGQFAGIIAKLSSIPESAAHDPTAQLLIYRDAFLEYALLAFVVVVILLAMWWLLKKILRPLIES